MNHQRSLRKLNRTPAHRRALLRNMATNLVLHGRIETTLPKAKALKRVADKLITLGKKNTLHTRRQAMSYLFEVNKKETGNAEKRSAVHTLFSELAPKYAERKGGYTRVVRTRKRSGDNAQLAVIEFVEEELAVKAPKRKRRVVRKTEAAAEPEVKAAETSEEVPATEDAPAAESAEDTAKSED